MFSFDSFLTNVGYISRGGVTPATVDRTANDNVFGFQFNTVGVNTGQFSHFPVIQTNRSNYTSGLFSIQDGSAGTGATFQPSAVTSSPPRGSSSAPDSSAPLLASVASSSRHKSLWLKSSCLQARTFLLL